MSLSFFPSVLLPTILLHCFYFCKGRIYVVKKCTLFLSLQKNVLSLTFQFYPNYHNFKILSLKCFKKFFFFLKINCTWPTFFIISAFQSNVCVQNWRTTNTFDWNALMMKKIGRMQIIYFLKYFFLNIHGIILKLW